jgi:hypothetical protein
MRIPSTLTTNTSIVDLPPIPDVFLETQVKLAGKVFAILRKRPDPDYEQTSTGRLKANSLAGHDDYSDIPRIPTGPLTLDSTPNSRHDDPQSPNSSSFGMVTSSADDSADVHQRYELEGLVQSSKG